MTDYIEQFLTNYSTPIILDAAYRANVPFRLPSPGIAPLNRADKLAGPVVTVEANNDIVSVMQAVHEGNARQVVVIANRSPNVAMLGDLITTEAHHKGLAGFVLNGCVRDVTAILEIGLPVFCRGATPLGPLKMPAELKGIGETNVQIAFDEAIIQPGDWVFGDADGVLFVSVEHLAAVFEQAAIAESREEQLVAQMREGQTLADIFNLEAFLAQRTQDPSADFNVHLSNIGGAL
jgi:4-hydroxy-4-methyl-2-oxoglutarate aldolase